MRRATAALALALAALFTGACSSVPRLVSADELDARERHILELERQTAEARAENAELRARLAQLERDCAPNAPAPQPPAALPPPPIEAPEIVPAPRVELEESDLAEAQAAPTTESGGAARYEAALVALRDGHNEEAERELLAFAQAEPASDLADNAWFWLAESRLARGDSLGAIEAYRTTIDRYPDGNKIPDALLKLGVAFEGVGNRVAAREAWQELVRRFPTSAAAETAAARLETP